MPKFMIILVDHMPTVGAMSPDEIQRVIARYTAWSAKVAQSGRLVGGDKLKDEGGRHLTAPQGRLVVRDGPFAEAKEVVGGYFLIEAADYDEAVRIASDCPHLELGGRIELREIDVI